MIAISSGYFAGLPLEALRPLPTTGLAHDHFRLGDSGWLIRAPKQSQFGFGALDNLRKFVGGKSPAVEQRIFDEAREAMTQMVADHGRVHGGAVSIRLLEGSVSRTLMDEADAMGADLVHRVVKV